MSRRLVSTLLLALLTPSAALACAMPHREEMALVKAMDAIDAAAAPAAPAAPVVPAVPAVVSPPVAAPALA
ncbi:MAG: hypothetical protein Q8P41_15975, partial [Pseudomonadota bacterium]|nr:hypothetical protein [Pseudomonadota bacterium]